jgi:hypothetical protein
VDLLPWAGAAIISSIFCRGDYNLPSSSRRCNSGTYDCTHITTHGANGWAYLDSNSTYRGAYYQANNPHGYTYFKAHHRAFSIPEQITLQSAINAAYKSSITATNASTNGTYKSAYNDTNQPHFCSYPGIVRDRAWCSIE